MLGQIDQSQNSYHLGAHDLSTTLLLSLSFKKEEVQLHQEASWEDGSRATGGGLVRPALTSHRPRGREQVSHLLVGVLTGTMSVSCALCFLRLVPCIGGQAQKSNLKKILEGVQKYPYTEISLLQ